MSLLEDLGQRQLARVLFRVMRRERYLRAKSRTLKETDVGHDWPLAVPEIELFWVAEAIFVRANGTLYWVNGWAETFLRGIGEEVRDIREIQRPNLDFPGALKTTTPLFRLAKEMRDWDSPPRFSRWWWRKRGLWAVKALFTPLTLTWKIAGLIFQGFSALISGTGGSIFALLFLLLGLALTILTTGLLFQELWGAFIGLWQKPFWGHGIFYVIGGITAPLAIAVYLVRHQDQDGQR